MDSYKILWNRECLVKTLFNPILDEVYVPDHLTEIAELPCVVVNACFGSKKRALLFLSKIFSTFLSWQIQNKKPSLSDTFCDFNKNILQILLHPQWWSNSLNDFFKENEVEFNKTHLWLKMD